MRNCFYFELNVPWGASAAYFHGLEDVPRWAKIGIGLHGCSVPFLTLSTSECRGVDWLSSANEKTRGTIVFLLY
jgi:hypothetical protein